MKKKMEHSLEIHGLNHLLNLISASSPSPFAQQMFCLLLRYYNDVRTRKALIPKLDYIAHSSLQLSTHMQRRSNAKCVSASTTAILLTTARIFHDINCFGHEIYTPQIRIY